MFDGRVFYKTGAALLKDRTSHRVGVFGSSSRWAPADLNARVGTYSWRRSEMYSGASPFSALHTWMSSLYCILCSTGSQCSFNMTGLIWSLKRVRVTTRAAMFWHVCSLATVSSGIPASRVLFMSRRDVTKALTIFSHESRSRNLLILPMFLIW